MAELELIVPDFDPEREALGCLAVCLVTGQITRGEFDEALWSLKLEVLPAFQRRGDTREAAITQGKIADILQSRGQLEKALQIREQEQLLVFQRLGDIREAAITHGRIAAQIACELVCGTAPGMLVTQKWVTPSST